MGQATVVPKGFECLGSAGPHKSRHSDSGGPCSAVSEPCSALLCNSDGVGDLSATPPGGRSEAFLEEAQGAGFKGCRAGWEWQQEECRCLYSTCFSRLLLSPNLSWGPRQPFQKEP